MARATENRYEKIIREMRYSPLTKISKDSIIAVRHSNLGFTQGREKKTNKTELKLGDFTESATQDVLNMSLYGGTHTVVAYGRKNIKYYNASNQLIREENFLRVATGYSTSPLVYIMVDGVVGEFIEGNIVAIS